MTIATNAALLLTGDSGSGKSSLIATAAEYLWETQKKKLRLYTCDAGGFPNKVEVAVRHKLIEVWRMRTRVGGGGEGLVEETCAQASLGAWPAQVDSHGSGDSPERVSLVPFTSVQFILKCAEGHEVKRGNVEAGLAPALCPTCKKQVTLINGSVVREVIPNFPHVGAIAFDSLTSMSMWVLTALRRRRGAGGLSGGEKSALGRFQSGGMFFDGNNRADYGFAQGQAEEWINNSISLGGLMLPPIWTALEALVESVSAAPMWGPMVAGQAKTGIAPQWAGNYIGCQTVQTEKGRQWRLCLTEFRGADGVARKYKCRVEPGFLPDFLTDGEGEKPLTTFNLGVFFGLLESAFEQSMERSQKRFGEVPDFSAAAPVVGQVGAAAGVAAPAANGGALGVAVAAGVAGSAGAPIKTPGAGGMKPLGLPPLGGKVTKAPIVGKVDKGDIPY